MIKSNNLIKSAFILALGSFFSKFLGAIYRIPLTSMLGTYGIGLYQMVFPVYTLLLDFSGAGAPNAISKLISENRDNNDSLYVDKILIVSKNLLVKLGLIFSIFMALFSYPISLAQGNSNSFLSYILLSPAILLCCLISVYRGYYQGFMNMKPTSISQVIEQLIKLSFGLTFAYFFKSNILLSVSLSIFSITLSEIVAFLFLYIKFCKHKKTNDKIIIEKEERIQIKLKVIKNIIPISLLGVVMPLIHVIDSFMIVNILGKYLDNATSLYGLMTGVVHTLVSLPVSICYSISTVAVPFVSRSNSLKEKQKNGTKTIALTFFLASFFVIIIIIFSNNLISILFKRLTIDDKILSNGLLRLSAINILLLSLIQTENAVLLGQNKMYFPLISMGVGIVIKVVLNFILLNNTTINIYGSAIALISCYFVCNLINLIMIFNVKVKNANKKFKCWQLQN